MATVNLGRVGFVPKGVYNPATAYIKMDIVSYNGSNYAAQANSTGVTPGSDDTKWKLFIDNSAATAAASAATDAATAANAAAASAGAAVSYLADLYSSSATYAVGDYCIYDGKMYRCNTAIASPGETWTAAHWTEVQTMGEVGEASAALTHVETALDITPTIIGSLSFTSGKVVNYSNGELTSASWGSYTALIDIEDYSEIIYPKMGATNAPTSKPGIAFYNSQESFVSGVSCDVNQEELGYRYVKIKRPAGAKYIRLSKLNSATSDMLYLKTTDILESGVKNDVDALGMQGETCVNLFDMSGAIIGGYINTSNGNIISRDDHFYAYIPISGAGTYRYYNDAHLYGETSAKKIIIYNSEKEYAGQITATHFGSEADSYWYGVAFEISNNDIASGYAYIGVSQAVGTISKFMVVKDIAYPETYYPYFADRTVLEGVCMKAANAIGTMKNSLYNKTALFFGDSICNGSSAHDNKFGWAGRIGSANEMAWMNYGQNGATICTQAGRSSITNQVAGAMDEYDTPDYAIIEGGTNDADLDAIELGTYTEDDYEGTYDTTTFSGAFETLIYNCLTNWPHAKTGYIVAQKMGSSADSRAERKTFFDRAMEICAKWGIPCLNLWDGTPLNPMIGSMYDSTKTSAENIEAGSMYVDGQHLTPDGYAYITPIIEHWMRGL